MQRKSCCSRCCFRRHRCSRSCSTAILLPLAPVPPVFRESSALHTPILRSRAAHYHSSSLFQCGWCPGRPFPPRALPFFFTPVTDAAPGPSSAAPPAVAAASAPAQPICQSPAAPTAPAAAGVPCGPKVRRRVGCFPWCQFFFCFLVMAPQLLGLGGRTRATAAAAASEAPAESSVSASYSAPFRSASAAGPCVVAPGEGAAPAAVDKPSRFIAPPAVASSAGRDNHACCLLSPS